MNKYALTVAAAVSSLALAAPATAVTSAGEVASAQPWVNITTNATGIHFNLRTTSGKVAWMVTRDDVVSFYGIERAGSAKASVRFAGHTGKHVVRVYRNGVEVFHQTLRTGR